MKACNANIISFLFPFMIIICCLHTQVEEKNSAQYNCVCPEGFTGDKCSTSISPSPQPRSQEGSGGMPKAAIAGIVAGVLLAALVCAVLVVVGLCVRRRRSRRSQGELKAHSFY